MSENYKKEYCHICKKMTMHEDQFCMQEHAICEFCEEEFSLEKQNLFNFCPFCGKQYLDRRAYG